MPSYLAERERTYQRTRSLLIRSQGSSGVSGAATRWNDVEKGLGMDLVCPNCVLHPTMMGSTVQDCACATRRGVLLSTYGSVGLVTDFLAAASLFFLFARTPPSFLPSSLLTKLHYTPVAIKATANQPPTEFHSSQHNDLSIRGQAVGTYCNYYISVSP